MWMAIFCLESSCQPFATFFSFFSCVAQLHIDSKMDV